MHRHRTSRFHSLRPSTQAPARWVRLQQRSGLLLLILAGLVMTAMLAWAPQLYKQELVKDARQKFETAHWVDFEAVERHWKNLPILQAIKTGAEPDVQRFLTNQPLVVALLDRFEGRRLWFREGDRLVPPGDQALSQLYLGWLSHAETAQRFEWNPSKGQDPDYGRIATVVLLSDRWLVIKRWNPGSKEVEKELGLALAPNPTLRMGLIRESDADRTDLVPQNWGKMPLLQADPARLVGYALLMVTKTNAFGDGWNLGGIAFADPENAFWDFLEKRLRAAYAVSILVGLAIAVGMWLRYRTRRKALLDADRLASMTHSLKTPLAILKLRCDSLRLGRLDAEQADATLIRIGDEVDHLTLIIENSLRVVLGGAPSGPLGQAKKAWFEEVAEDLLPAFEEEHRELELHLTNEIAEAPLPSLRAALLTLLENALGHGKGRVKLETWRQRRRLCIQVSDEGEGVQPHQLKALGKPFQRLRESGKEGFMRDGQGLGLSLLIQVAHQEGWGLSFSSAPGQGFIALLEVPASRSPLPQPR
jgi:signal transduction histidine kinase